MDYNLCMIIGHWVTTDQKVTQNNSTEDIASHQEAEFFPITSGVLPPWHSNSHENILVLTPPYSNTKIASIFQLTIEPAKSQSWHVI